MRDKIIFGLIVFLECSSVFAAGPQGAAASNTPNISQNSQVSAWKDVPQATAQCTEGARKQSHYAKVRISTFHKDYRFSIELLSTAAPNVVNTAMALHPNAHYIGNGPIFMEDSHPNGYVRSEGKTLAPLDCVHFRSNHGNVGHENSVFVRYLPKGHGMTNSDVWKYRVVSADFLCRQLQPKAYVDWIKAHPDSGAKLDRDTADDLLDESQIDFAIQSGPGVLRDDKNLLAGYNAGAPYRSYIGVNHDGNPVVVETDGLIGSYCLGDYLLTQGIRDLLHRDSFISDAAYRESAGGQVTGYPTPNPNAKAASLLVISPD